MDFFHHPEKEALEAWPMESTWEQETGSGLRCTGPGIGQHRCLWFGKEARGWVGEA